MGIFITAWLLRIQQHLLERNSACYRRWRRGSRDHSINYTQKYGKSSVAVIYMTIVLLHDYLQDKHNLFVGSTSQQSSYSSQSIIQDSCTLLLNCGDPLLSELHSSRSPAKVKENSIMLFTSSYFSYNVLATYCHLILQNYYGKNYLYKILPPNPHSIGTREFTPPVAVYIHSLFQLLYHQFLSQMADPSFSKATKVARLQLACKPGSSLSQRTLLLNALSYTSPISHFPFLRSSFLVLPVLITVCLVCVCAPRHNHNTMAGVHGCQFRLHLQLYMVCGMLKQAKLSFGRLVLWISLWSPSADLLYTD